jgi:hypothetical protein
MRQTTSRMDGKEKATRKGTTKEKTQWRRRRRI